MRSVAQLVGQCKNLMRTVKETKNLCNAKQQFIRLKSTLVQLQSYPCRICLRGLRKWRNERRKHEFFRCNERRKQVDKDREWCRCKEHHRFCASRHVCDNRFHENSVRG